MTASGIRTQAVTVRFQLADPVPNTLFSVAIELLCVNSLVSVATWISENERTTLPPDQVTDVAPRRSEPASQFHVVGLSIYNSPLWLAIAGAAGPTTLAVGYSVQRLYNKYLDLRKKKSDVDLHVLVNEQIMDDLKFTHDQKTEVRAVIERLGSPPESDRESRLRSVAIPIEQASRALEMVDDIQIEQA